MKGFKATGYGPSAGFKFSSKHGFTGSTGNVIGVAPYVRRKAFADGGFVRQDTPRMKADMIGDQGSALVRRARSSTDLDAVSGGKTPIRPGYRNGGMAKRGGGLMQAAGMMPMRKGKKMPMKKASGGNVSAKGHGPIRARVGSATTPMKEKFYADGGAAMRQSQKRLSINKYWFDHAENDREKQSAQHRADQLTSPNHRVNLKSTKSIKPFNPYADGGKVVRGSSAKGFWASVKDIPELINQLPALAADAGQRSLARTQKDVADTKRRRIDSIVDHGNSRFARGGKARMTKC